jgi:Tol biopolymer transport system component
MYDYSCTAGGQSRWLGLTSGLLVGLLLTAIRLAGQEAAPTEPDVDLDQKNRIFIAQPDGSGMKPLVDLPDYTTQGSPTWSQDGTLIAFDAWRPKLGETNQNSKVIVVNADGTNPRILGDGAMPHFSPRHNRIVFSRYSPNYGIWVMSIEGPEKELVLVDESGWSADWSPDGKQLVYATYEPNGANLMVFDLVEGVKFGLFEEGASPYSNFYWHIAWSPDGRHIVFKGQRADNDKFEVGIIDARGAKHGLVVRLDGEVTPNFGWTHDSSRVVFSQKTPDRGNRVQLYTMNRGTMEPPELLPGQDPERLNGEGVYSPDGKQLLIVSRKPPPRNNAAKKKAAK